MNKEVKITKENATEELLMGVHYGKLLDTFKELGVESCWKAGGKKAAMVKNALDRLSQLKDMKSEDLSEDQILDALEDIDREEAKAEMKAKEAAESKAKDEKTVFEKIVATKYKFMNKEELEAKIFKISNLVLNCTPGHKTHYLNLLSALEKMLENKEYKK